MPAALQVIKVNQLTANQLAMVSAALLTMLEINYFMMLLSWAQEQTLQHEVVISVLACIGAQVLHACRLPSLSDCLLDACKSCSLKRRLGDY